ncbi:unnamed protein product [Rotaria magnacalcarata]|uniref:Uncharacterized protein n=2 Tax=Rotaria magnacalcarata TaxID=392030 RepID=A0A815UNV6_9BILA|nr:unnamed protein product [Rotaria magnacalcarata]CAF2146728.1 unnamed protein product [Rotaria magnacalcarata]CAF4441999.1 unnamed protein product [Rotaria magnacalcarata]
MGSLFNKPPPPAELEVDPWVYTRHGWEKTDWIERYIPTQHKRGKQPVIYVAAFLPAASPCCGGFGGVPQFGSSFPFGGGYQ